MEANIGLTTENKNQVSKQLTILLADEYVLFTKTKNAHWNVEGPDFHAKHLFFESQFGQLDEIVDQVAERIRSIGHYSVATLTGFLGVTRLTEASRSGNLSQDYIKELLMDHESIIEFIRSNVDSFAAKYHDFGSSDFITGIMEEHEKMAWMLRSHLK